MAGGYVMLYRILGPLEVLDDEGRNVPLRGRRERVLLAALLLEANRVVSVDRLIDALWGEHPPETAPNTLQVHVSNLRKRLAGASNTDSPLHTEAPGYVLRTIPGQLDSERFESLAVASHPHEGPEALSARLADALALWGGSVLAGLEIDAFGRSDVTRLEELRISAIERRIEADLALGRHLHLVGELEGLVHAHSLREVFRAQLMLALYRSGRQADALTVYQQTRRVLAEELGIDPSPTLRELELAILNQSAELDPPRGAKATRIAAEWPSGTVTFLFTDIEGSTRLWEQSSAAMALALKSHDKLLRSEIEDSGGYVFKTSGDAFCAAFSTAKQAVQVAVGAQRAMSAQLWPADAVLKVRMALHTGECDERDGEYVGPVLHRIARLESIAHGGQVVLTRATTDVVRDQLPVGVRLRDLGTHRLRDLGRPEEVFQLDIEGLEVDFPPLRSLDNPDILNNLPEMVSSFVGRQIELNEIRRLVTQSRIVTLAGPGGVGKTRLGLQVAAELLDGSGDGVWLVELAALGDPEAVAAAMARVLGIKEQSGRSMHDTLVEALADQSMLVVLDNCEHVIGACAKLAEVVVRGCPRVHLLATSREPLGIDGEHVFRVPSLSLPPEGAGALSELAASEAVALFVERAGSQATDFVLTADTAPLVTAICRRLDGVPLALELATARLRSMSLTDLHERLDHRFRLLTGGSRTALPRQQTLRAMIDWSYDLLNEFECAVLRRLSVFAGGFELSAAEAVCGSGEVDGPLVADLLGSLVDKSLVQAESSQTTVRYRLLETIRQYAAEELLHCGESEARAARVAHAKVFLAMAETAEPHLAGPDQNQWLQRLDVERDNLRNALDHLNATPSAATEALRIIVALGRFWERRGYYSEGIELVHAALERADAQAPTSLRAAALTVLGLLHLLRGDTSAALTHYEESLSIAQPLGDRALIAEVLGLTSYVRFRQGDYGAAADLSDQAVTLARVSGDSRLIALALSRRANTGNQRPDAARADLAEAVAYFRAAGDSGRILHALHNLGVLELESGNLRMAQSHLEEARTIALDLHDNDYVAYALHNLGTVAVLQGDIQMALVCATDSLALARRVNDHGLFPYLVLEFALCATAVGEFGRAAILHGAADVLMDGLDESFEPLESTLHAQDHACLRERIGDDAFDRAYDSGKALTDKAILDFAIRQNADEPVQ